MVESWSRNARYAQWGQRHFSTTDGEKLEKSDGGGDGGGRVWEGEIYGRGEVLLTSKSAQEIPSLVRATPDKYVFNVPP